MYYVNQEKSARSFERMSGKDVSKQLRTLQFTLSIIQFSNVSRDDKRKFLLSIVRSEYLVETSGFCPKVFPIWQSQLHFEALIENAKISYPKSRTTAFSLEKKNRICPILSGNANFSILTCTKFSNHALQSFYS